MATAAPGPLSNSFPADAAGKLVGYDHYIEGQLRKTRGQVRAVDIGTAVMTLLVASLAFLLVVVLADQWLVTGGLPLGVRIVALLVLLGGSVWYAITRLLPLLLRRINPVYAAETIERSKPSLKNSLVNFLLLRSNHDGLPDVVYQAVEEQAAVGLSNVPVEHVVDHSRLLRVGYVLLAMVCVLCLYKVLSPKDPLRSVGRVILPWANLQAATRVEISDVKPGSGNVFRGDEIEVSAEVHGLKDDEVVTLYYGTLDRQKVDQAVPMYVPRDGYRHKCKLPLVDGIQQGIEYRLKAGDAVTPSFTLQVLTAPTINVASIEYQYPKYTGLDPSKVERQGDIKALEGTVVTIHALANQPIKEAYLEFDGGQPGPRMSVDGQRAIASFTLALVDGKDKADPKASALARVPEHTSYRVRFKNTDGKLNPQPVQYQIDVTPDLPPEVAILDPTKDETIVPLDGRVNFEVQAKDPDFGLSSVQFLATSQNKSVLDKPLLVNGKLIDKFTLSPKALNLKEGMVVEYWAEATDNKTPKPNRTATVKRTLRIGSNAGGKQSDQLTRNDDPNNNPPPNNDPQQNPDQKNPSDKQAGKSDKDAGKSDERQGGDANQQPRQPGDDKTDDNRQSGADNKPEDGTKNDSADSKRPEDQQNSSAKSEDPHDDQPEQKASDRDAFQKLADRQRQEAEKNKPQGDKKNDSIENAGQRPNDPQQQPDNKSSQQPKKSTDKGDNSKQPSGQQKPDDKQSGQPHQSPDKKGGEQKSGDQKSGDSKQGGDQKSGDSKGGDQKNAGQQGGDSKQGDQKNAGEKSAGNSGAKPDSKSNPGGQSKSGEKSNGEQGGSQQSPMGDKPQPSGKQPAGDQQRGDKGGSSGDKPAGEKPMNGNQPGADKQQGGQPSSKSDPSQQGGNPKADGQQPNNQQAGAKQPDGKQAGDQSQGADSQKGGSNPSSKNQAGDQKQPDSDKQPGGAKPDDKNDGRNSKGGDPQGQEGGSDKPQNQSGQPSDKPGKSNDKAGQPGDKTGESNKPSGAGQGDKQQPMPGKQADGGAKPDGDKQPGGAKPDGAKSSGQPNSSNQPNADEKRNGSPNGGEKQPGGQSKPDQKPGDKNADDPAGKQAGEAAQNKPMPDQHPKGDGGQAHDATQPNPKSQPDKAAAKQGGDPKGGDAETPKGDSGAGTGDSQKGSPASQENDKAVQNKPQGQNAGDNKPKDSAQSPAHGKESKSNEGDADGDLKGGGGKGGGQGANKEGTGGKGKNTPSDEGAGAAQQPGKGENSSKPGNDAKSDQATGQSGTEPGHGSNGGKQSDTKQNDQSNKPADNTGGDGSGKPSGDAASPQPGEASGHKPGASTDANNQGEHGGAGTNSPPGNASEFNGRLPGEEDPNLDYAKKATDLALDYLKNHADKPDPELLKDLNWTEADWNNFRQRWQQMRAEADEGGDKGEAARDALRSLGLGPRSGNISRKGEHNSDQLSGSKDSQRTRPPAEYAEQFKAYTQGINKSK